MSYGFGPLIGTFTPMFSWVRSRMPTVRATGERHAVQPGERIDGPAVVVEGVFVMDLKRRDDGGDELARGCSSGTGSSRSPRR